MANKWGKEEGDRGKEEEGKEELIIEKEIKVIQRMNKRKEMEKVNRDQGNEEI